MSHGFSNGPWLLTPISLGLRPSFVLPLPIIPIRLSASRMICNRTLTPFLTSFTMVILVYDALCSRTDLPDLCDQTVPFISKLPPKTSDGGLHSTQIQAQAADTSNEGPKLLLGGNMGLERWVD